MEKPKLGDFVDVDHCGKKCEKCEVVIIYHKDLPDQQFFIVTDCKEFGAPLSAHRIFDFASDPDDYLLHKNINNSEDKNGKWFYLCDILNVYSSSVKKSTANGCHCRDCNEYYPYAEPNQPDGTLLCYSCRGRA